MKSRIAYYLPAMLAFLLAFAGARGQTVPDTALEDLSGRISERADPDADIAGMLEEETSSIRHLNLNRASAEELKRLPFLTGSQAESIVNYIVMYGAILSKYELRVIPGLDSAAIRKLEPFLAKPEEEAGPPWTIRNLLRHGKHSIILRAGRSLQKAEGYRTGSYEGSPAAYLFRYAYRFSDRLKIGLGGEKDAGEPFFKGNQRYGMDFYCGYLALTNTRFIRMLAAGNFSLSFGQGLTLGSGSVLGSDPGTGVPCRVSQGIRPSGSMAENRYFRGAGTTLQFGRFGLSAFFSRHKRDARTEEPDSLHPGGTLITSLPESGYHRTGMENSIRKKVTESVYGGNLTWTGSFFRVGITGFSAGWDRPIRPGDGLHCRHAFGGRSMSAAGVDVIVRLNFITLFAEGSRSFPGGCAFLGGVYAEPDTRVFFSATGRHYACSYQNFFSDAPGQSGLNSGEEGLTLRMGLKLASRLNLSAFADLYRYLWLRYRVNRPSEGMDSEVSLEWQPSGVLLFHVRYRHRSGMINYPESAERIRPVAESSVNGLRIRMDWTFTERFRSRSFAEASWGGGDDPGVQGEGYLAGQEFRYRPLRPAVSLSIRYLLFDIPVHGLRIYSYEPDVASAFSAPAYEGKGIRGIFLFTWDPVRSVGIQGRYSLTWRSGRDQTGNGPETVSGPLRSEFRVQLRIRI